MRQSTILINAALIIVKLVFTVMNERAQSATNSGRKSLADSASGILIGQREHRSNAPAVDEQKTVALDGDYAYVNSGRSLIIYNVSNRRTPTIVSETLF